MQLFFIFHLNRVLIGGTGKKSCCTCSTHFRTNPCRPLQHNCVKVTHFGFNENVSKQLKTIIYFYAAPCSPVEYTTRGFKNWRWRFVKPNIINRLAKANRIAHIPGNGCLCTTSAGKPRSLPSALTSSLWNSDKGSMTRPCWIRKQKFSFETNLACEQALPLKMARGRHTRAW